MVESFQGFVELNRRDQVELIHCHSHAERCRQGCARRRELHVLEEEEEQGAVMEMLNYTPLRVALIWESLDDRNPMHSMIVIDDDAVPASVHEPAIER